MYIDRTIEAVIEKTLQSFKVILITGSRQVGKSTVLIHLFKNSEYEYVTLDDQLERETAEREPKAFFLNHPGKLIIDEIQYAPSLFREIKFRVDQRSEYGQYILTGSQTFSLMSGITESLAGRVGILKMAGLSLREITNDRRTLPFVPDEVFLQNNENSIQGKELWRVIHRGSLPELSKNSNIDLSLYYSSYVSTYIERDVRIITNVRDLSVFSQFISVLAARVAQLVNYTEIARELGIDSKTVKSWLSILEASGVIILVQPFSNNRLNRSVKTPKLYFLDSGLVAYLLRWTTAETLMNGAMSGQIFENFAVSEVVKSFYNYGIPDVPIYFYRDRDKKEIDLVIEASGVLYPVEIKQTLSPNINMGKHLNLLEKAVGFKVGQQIILCQVSKKHYMSQDIVAYPVGGI